MWCWRPPQIRHHQDRYEAVATLIKATFHSAEDIFFPIIPTDVNGPLLHCHCYIAAATYDLAKVKCCAGGHSKLGIIRTDTAL